MKIVVIGGTGLVGSKVVAQLADQGHDAVPASPSTGIDTITLAGLRQALSEAEVVIDATKPPSWQDAAAALDFFLTSTRNLLDTEVAAGVEHHVALSVVGVDRMLASGYFRAKIVQESLVRSGPVPHTIVRATQFFEFIESIADAATDGGTVRLPPALVQPIAATDVAAAVSNAAIGPPANGIVEVAGPELFRLDELVRLRLRARHDRRQVVSDPSARYFGWVQLDEHTLIPAADAEHRGTRFEEWLAEESSRDLASGSTP